MRAAAPRRVGLLLALMGCAWLLGAALALAETGAAKPPAAPALPPFLLGGIQTAECDVDAWMAALKQNGMNAVQVTIYAEQAGWDDARLTFDEAPHVVEEIRAARRAGIAVVLVLRIQFPYVAPAEAAQDPNRFLWHGMIFPRTDAATRAWFRRYDAFVAHWARIAEAEGVAMLGIASELNALAATLPIEETPVLPAYYLSDDDQQRLRALVQRLEPRVDDETRASMGAADFASLVDFVTARNAVERAWARVYTFADADDPLAAMNRRRALLDREWRMLIERTRAIYRGPLTFAANHDAYADMGFWDALDWMGINAYFPLRAGLDAPLRVDALTDAWRTVFDAVAAFRADRDLTLPILFTELGYTLRRGTTVAPWSDAGFVPVWAEDGDPANDDAFFWTAQPKHAHERALAVRALHRLWATGETPLRGLLYWKLSTLPEMRKYEAFMLDLDPAIDDPLRGELQRFVNVAPAGKEDAP
ncbi:MAG: hypothetical protein AAF772_02440 [Acidobacteriota bacterium]